MRVDVYFKMSIGHEYANNPKDSLNLVKYMTDSDFRAKCELDHVDVFNGNKSCENCIFSDIRELSDGSMVSDCAFQQGTPKRAWEYVADSCYYYEPCPDEVLKKEDLE